MNSTTARNIPLIPSSDTSKADPFYCRDFHEWAEGLFAWGERWRDAYQELWRETHGKRPRKRRKG